MSLDAEVLVDRRNIQRRLTFWRFIAILLAILAIILLSSTAGNFAKNFGGQSQIARVNIEGIITDNAKQQKLLKDLAEAKHVKAVLLKINSPGGTTTGGEALYDSIRALSEKKPVVAVFGTVAASAAYIAGLATDHIVARGNSITGSVGVIFQFADVSELLNKVGVKVEEIKSGPLKANPSPFQPIDEAGRTLSGELVAEAQSWFLGLVEERRGLTPLEMQNVKDGRIFSGRQAVKLKLVDQIGGENEAISWLEKEKKLEKKLPIHDWKPKSDDPYAGLLGSANGLDRVLGLPSGTIDKIRRSSPILERLQLDGLVSVWQPHSSK